MTAEPTSLARRIGEAADRVQRARAIAVLTGAGVSAESGVPTFRGEGGLWRQFRAEDLATPQAFARDPRLVWEWYDWRRQKIAACRPNPAHHALAQLEARAADFLLITQNIDDLHRKAGSRLLVELHGNIWRVRCPREGSVADLPDVPLREIPPRCECGALLRPDIVWFGETLPDDALDRAFRAAEACDLFLVAGTSALVQPAASLPLVAKRHGATIVEVNPQPTPISPMVDLALPGKAGEMLPALLAAFDGGG
jgi:NAD-dependent protein deacetylase/lipoamidase